MFVVRDAQIEALEQHLFGAMQARVERAIAETFPELRSRAWTSGADPVKDEDAQIRSIVERGIENAVNYDIVEPPDFAAFIGLGLALRLMPVGPSGNWINSYINRPNTPGQIKLRMIESRLRFLGEDNATFRAIAQRMAQARGRAAQ